MRKIVLIAAVILCALASLPVAPPVKAADDIPDPVSGQVGLKVNGAIAQFDAVPGKTYIHRMIVENSEDYPGMEVQVSACGLGETLDGGYKALNQTDSTSSPYSAYQFISNIDVKSFHLGPGAQQALQATIAIPDTAKITGGRYAMIHIKPILDKAANVLFIPEIYVPIVLNFGSWDIKGKITDVNVEKIESGKPIVCDVTLQNAGNYHYKAQENVVIKDTAGTTVAEATSPLTNLSIIPSYSFRFPVELEPKNALAPGTYSLETKAILQDGRVLDTAKSSFDVVRNYIRFQAEPEASAGTNWAFVGGTIFFVSCGAFLILGFAARRRRI